MTRAKAATAYTAPDGQSPVVIGTAYGCVICAQRLPL